MYNMRRNFRYNVEIPIFFEEIEASGNLSKLKRSEIIPFEKEHQLQAINDDILHLFSTVFVKNSETAMIFNLLNHRLDYLSWLQNLILDGKNPLEQHDFKFRRREDAKHQMPRLNSKTIGLLIQAVFKRIGQYIEGILKAIEGGLDTKVLRFDMELLVPFKSTDYVTNLQDLAKQQVAPAKMLILLIDKLNILGDVDRKLKLAFQGVSDSSTWPVEKINLSAGGFGVETTQIYPDFSHLNVFLKIEKTIIACQGKVVLNKPTEKGFKVGVEFEFLSSEYVQFITLFIQHEEIKEAMKAFPSV